MLPSHIPPLIPLDPIYFIVLTYSCIPRILAATAFHVYFYTVAFSGYANSRTNRQYRLALTQSFALPGIIPRTIASH
jgi:hypothetical protein